ncbi:MAG TPA: tetrahydrofolate dehydrogenase/cyclohydrolase catalytic domain-containing protein, partial [Candidatus Deferrimicrobium sp.]|nr:tetrahydrofolate dehydrogenase/cyclohydrolase catalytic domain-containing protein [Candidatus Deferrimicrobium sp.]
MTAQLIDGDRISAIIRDEIKAEVEEMKSRYGKVPGLATVIVGERKDSQTYVKMKKKACAYVGVTSFGKELPEDISQEELIKVVEELNADPNVHGILVQLPLPSHIDEEAIL